MSRRNGFPAPRRTAPARRRKQTRAERAAARFNRCFDVGDAVDVRLHDGRWAAAVILAKAWACGARATAKLFVPGVALSDFPVEKIRARRAPKIPAQAAERTCRVCGCTDEWGCDEGCEWVEADLCSACVEED